MLSSRSKSLLQGFIFSIIVSIVLVTLVPISSIFPQNSCQVEDNSYDSFLHYNQTFSDNLFSSSNLSSFTNDSLQLTLHDPIVITSNDDFLTYDFPGNGTELEPYRIENLEITAESYNGIFIRNIERYLIIQNCVIEAEIHGIDINSISSGYVLVQNNICHKSYAGIVISGSSNLSIESNSCSYNNYSGIAVGSSSEITVKNNTCFSNEIGMRIYSSESCIFTNNLVYNNLIGFQFQKIKLTTISNNRFYNDGITFPYKKYGSEYDYSQNIFENNTVNDLPFVYFYEISDQTISQTYGQIVLYRCNKIEIRSISISKTYRGIALIECSNFKLTNISTSNSNTGVYCIDSLNIEVNNVTFYYNSQGIHFSNTSYSKIYQNLFVNNLGYGASFNYRSSENKIYLNNFESNSLTSYGPQARDDGENNEWYSRENKQGNYWSDLTSEMCYYEIDGYANSYDYYPLNRVERCPDFFVRKKMRISLYSIFIPTLIVLFIKYLNTPSRRNRF
ncbi:MAG: right-handed parallel beta-helix repeat-containing protein [Candidatus Heimdallarchaeota archaeon]|nr:right-handed parallel beta-helix repeat-containing protein [Candidatus Heimdallarchaeota archaeon]MCK4770876.1 right-handed parallel beta-helix repeat-containing protein [Candidatus Heimdallarchaeota archaeon]